MKLVEGAASIHPKTFCASAYVPFAVEILVLGTSRKLSDVGLLYQDFWLQ